MPDQARHDASASYESTDLGFARLQPCVDEMGVDESGPARDNDRLDQSHFSRNFSIAYMVAAIAGTKIHPFLSTLMDS